MKRLLPLLLISATFISTGVFAGGGPTSNCQDLTVQLDGTGNYSFATGSSTPSVDQFQLTPAGTFTGLSAWQSFTAGSDGILYSVSLEFSSAYAPATTARVNIYSGEGTGGALLAQMNYANPISFSGVTEFILDETIDLVSGNQYTLQLVDDSAGPFSLRVQGDGTLYAGGISNVAGKDLVFSTSMLARPDIDNGSTATIGLASFTVSQETFTCANIGANTVILTVTENLGGSTTCTSTVTVEDNENPVAVCQDLGVTLDGASSVSVLASSVNNGSSDNCTISLSLSPSSFNCANVGSNPVTLTVTDPTGNSTNCSATITIIDNAFPNSVCQNHTLVLDGSGSATLVVADVDNGSSDNCGIASRAISKSSFNCGDLGTNTVTLTITDVNTLVSTCNATVTVEDNESPAITCPADIIICSADNSGSIVAYTEPAGTDNCSAVTNQTDASGLTNGSLFPIGTTTQTWTVSDGALTTSCSFDVVIEASPIADFIFSDACEGESVFFTDESTIDPSSSITTWTWDMGDGSGPISLVDPIHQYADTGMYSVTLMVTSADNCTDDTIYAVRVTPVPTAAFTFVEACEGAATVFTDASTIDAGMLNYSWNFGDGSSVSADENPSHVYVLDGTYTVTLTVTSDGGCEDVTTQSVNVDASPTALFSANTVCEGTTTVFNNLSTGGGTLSYSWDFGDASVASTEASPTYTYATGGTYTVVLTVTNDNLCEDVRTVLVTVNSLPTVDFTFADVCEGTPATFTNNSTIGSNSWDFGDLSSSTLNNPVHIYSTAGLYDVILTVTDANFCISSATQQIEVFDLPDFTLTSTDVLCYGEASGSINTTPQGSPTFPWMVSLNGGTPQVSGTFTGLPADDYDVTVMDDNGCEFTVSAVVDQPSDTLGINIGSLTDILCHGTTTGEINVSGTGGTSDYMYSIDGFTAQPTGDFAGLASGSHDIQIVDLNACVFDTTITLSEPDTLVLTFVNADNLLCNGDNSGSISVVGTGGVLDYEYNINSGVYGSSAMFDGLPAGLHIIGILDANGCSDTLNVTLTEPGVLMLSLISSEDAVCFQALNGFIEVAASSGTAPYQYSLNGVNFQGSGLFQGLGVGTYTITVRDANGCLDNITESIFEPSQLTIETNSSPVTCFGENDGSIQIVAAGGTTAYTYSIDGGVLFETSSSFTDLDGANYLTIVRDANGCTASEGVVISEPSSPFTLNANVTNVACLGGSTGSVLLVGSGGTPTYTYSENNIDFVSSNVVDGFSTGNFTLYAQDLSGCVDSIEFFVNQPSTAVNINSTLLSNPACPNQASGSVTVLASGGTPGYMYSSNNGATYQSSQILTGVSGGNSIIAVQDANGCVDTNVVTLVSPPIIDIAIDTIVNVNCEGNVDGEIHVIASGGTPSYSYTLNSGSIQTNGDFVNLTDGTYVVAVTDVNGCVYSEPFSVTANQMLPLAGFSVTVSGEAVLFQNNSSFGDTYLWEFGDDSTSTEETPVHLYSAPGNYDVTLTVTNDCGSNTITTNISTINTGIASNDAITFSLYPNPASTELFLISSENIEGALVAIISASGQLIYSEKLNTIQANNRTRIDVNGLAQGVYFLRLVSNTNQSVLRFDIIK
jgi:PKD repeat protein